LTLEQKLVALAQAIGADVKSITQQSQQAGPTGPMGPSGKNGILSITKLTASNTVTYTVPTGTNFQAINLNSDSSNRFAKITFIAPQGGSVLLEMRFNGIILDIESRLQIGLSQSSSQTDSPEKWYSINGDTTYQAGQYSAEFILNGLTPDQEYSYYFMAVSDVSGTQIRCSNYSSSTYSSVDRPAPLLIFAYDLGDSQISTNPSS